MARCEVSATLRARDERVFVVESVVSVLHRLLITKKRSSKTSLSPPHLRPLLALIAISSCL